MTTFPNLKQEIDDYCVKLYSEEPRGYLGASQIGEECARKLWYYFRWFARETFDGRMYRLFNVGHQAEPRFISYLVGIGFQVAPIDPSTGKQWNFKSVNGHFSGNCDGKAWRADVGEVLLEFKTNGTGAGYNAVETKGVRSAKPKHWAQMNAYGTAFGLSRALYLIENKNDSDITPQLVELEHDYGNELEIKAAFIINSKEAPPRISQNPSYVDCKTCFARGVCHSQHLPQKNCRTCVNSMPTENGTWACSKFGVIPEAAQRVGCNNWEPMR